MAPGGLKKKRPGERLLVQGAIFYKFWRIIATFAQSNDKKSVTDCSIL
jgi:hypothetical protein